MTRDPETPPPSAATSASETRFERGRRLTHRGALYTALGIVIATVLYLILLIVRNARQVKVDYVFGSGHTRLIWLVIVSALTGWLLGLATSFLLRRRTRRPG